MLLLLTSALLVLSGVFCTELCKEKEWYDDLVGKCRRCQTCIEKSWEVAPCTAFMDTMCVDLVEIGRSLEKNIKAGEKSHYLGPSKVSKWENGRWHEMEGPDLYPPVVDKKDDSVFDSLFGAWGWWDITLVCIIALLFFGCTMVLIFGIMKLFGKSRRWDNSKVPRTRLFSRDRLNTTEYMNNLATLDRRLAIDEILEKRKRAIFEPQLLKENLYTDEVFVDISGLPRNFRNNDENDEVDPKKCLLEMHGQQ